jgi:hypothetical protein
VKGGAASPPREANPNGSPCDSRNPRFHATEALKLAFPKIVVPEPENLVLALLRDMRSEMANMRENMATRADVGELRSEMNSLRADVASDIHRLDAKIEGVRRDLSDQIGGLRRAVMEYHSSAIGHGVLITELEERVRRVERHLNLPPLEAH